MALEYDKLIQADSASLPYHEPSRIVILTQSSFLILLNVIGIAMDKFLYCGLVAQILLGVAFGVPGADWLGTEVEKTMVQVGYLGLILVVYEGSTLYTLLLWFPPQLIPQLHFSRRFVNGYPQDYCKCLAFNHRGNCWNKCPYWIVFPSYPDCKCKSNPVLCSRGCSISDKSRYNIFDPDHCWPDEYTAWSHSI